MIFMNEIIVKGYIEVVLKEEVFYNDGNVWYIFYQGVYYFKKLEKIRVMFDCSVDYKREFLNKYFLIGFDLTNGFVGVLCQFRRDLVVFMCDLEVMFY